MVASITASQSLTARVKTVNPTFSPYPCRLGWRARLCLAAGLCALYPLAVAGPAAADDLIVPIEAPAQAATTDQSAAANGVATQDSPTNLVISVRIDSPGNDGAISQSNVAVVTVGAGNASQRELWADALEKENKVMAVRVATKIRTRELTVVRVTSGGSF